MKILVFGASGMIGSAMFRVLSAVADWQVMGTLRSSNDRNYFPINQQDNLFADINVEKPDVLIRIFNRVKPDIVVNCIGLTKHHKEAEDALIAIPLNALLPHRMADLCALAGARLVHISTDCVFFGSKGNYIETDIPDAADLYGRSKLLGEVYYPHAITLRTSTIGHELHSKYGLLEWFLSQSDSCKGFSRAIFSGLPNTELARIVRDLVVPRPDLHGLYHVGATPINKYELLNLIAKSYGKNIQIIKDDLFTINRSLNSERFWELVDCQPADWPELVESMHLLR